MELTATEALRSTCHQGFGSMLVAVTEPSEKFPSVLPSTADAAPSVGYPGSVLLWRVNLPNATFVGTTDPPTPITCTSARLKLFVPVSCTRTYRPCASAAMIVDGLGAEV